MKTIITIIGFILALFICAHGQNATPDDEIAIRKTAMDYIEEVARGDGFRDALIKPLLSEARVLLGDHDF